MMTGRRSLLSVAFCSEQVEHSLTRNGSDLGLEFPGTNIDDAIAKKIDSD